MFNEPIQNPAYLAFNNILTKYDYLPTVIKKKRLHNSYNLSLNTRLTI